MQQNKPSRRRVLLLAYYCNPNRGSEFAVGWHRALQCAKHFDTWVLTEGGENASQIKAYLREHGPLADLHFEFVELGAGEKRLADNLWLRWLAFGRWHKRALTVAQTLHRTVGFDLTHQVTCISYREPGHLWKLDVPFVWGPVGGTESFPWRFLPGAGFAGAISEALRNLVNSAQLRWSRRVRQAAQRASALLVSNSTGRRKLHQATGVTGRLMLDVGIRQVARSPQAPRTDGGPLRVLWSGVFEPRKALPLLLQALAQMPPEVAVELRVLGDGPMNQRWKRQAERLKIDSRIKWMGWLSYEEAQKHYDWADVFAFTSLRDNSGTVVLEAMAKGLPVVCLDHHGVHDMVTEACGNKVPVTRPEQTVPHLRDALVRLAGDPGLRFTMGEAALQRVQDYLWNRLGQQMIDVYEQVWTWDAEADRFTHGAEDDVSAVGLASAPGGGADKTRRTALSQYVG